MPYMHQKRDTVRETRWTNPKICFTTKNNVKIKIDNKKLKNKTKISDIPIETPHPNLSNYATAYKNKLTSATLSELSEF